jgi:hypothetical protein
MTLTELTGWVEAALGERLVAFVLYGSAAREGERGESGGDVNTLLICDTVDEAVLAALESGVARWVASGQPAPLVFGQAEWRASTDAFAIEIEEIRAAHRVLAGRAPWDGMSVRREDVRRQLEQELRGKVLRLRQGYLAARGDGARLGALVQATAGAWLTMLRALLRVAGRPVPAGAAALVTAAAELTGFPAEPTAGLIAAARTAEPLVLQARDARAAAYLAAVGRTADAVNAL